MCDDKYVTGVVKLLFVAALLFVLSTAPASAEVYGIKSKDPTSSPPTHLFKFEEDGSGLTDLGPVTVGGSDVDLDGLAYSPVHGLLAYHMLAGSSQLISLTTSPPVGTPIGSPLAGREIRGALFDFDDRLLVIDCANDELVEIDPATGAEIGMAIPLTEDGAPHDLRDISDIALRGDGTFYIASYAGSTNGQIYELDRSTGRMVLSHSLGSDYLAGITFSSDSMGNDQLISYDVKSDDDLYFLETDNSFSKTMLYSNFLPQFNAGRGDLAALIEPAPLRADSTFLEAQGDTIDFTIEPGASFAGRNYLLVASLSGTDPGTLLPGGLVTIPLNRDWLTDFILQRLNNSVFTGFWGVIDANGLAGARLNAPPIPNLTGEVIHFAYAINNPWDFASNAVAIEVVP